MATIRNKRLLKTLEIDGRQLALSTFRQVPVGDLKKVSRAITILQQSNARLGKVVKHMHVYYEQKYKTKVVELEAALERKCRKIARLREESAPPSYLFIVRKENCVYFYKNFADVNAILRNSDDCRVLLCRVSKATIVEQALCTAVASSKYTDCIVATSNTIQFIRSADADSFENDVQIMFNSGSNN
ncbi:ORF-29 [Agrotis segetum nucleopolyhedrovirus A]|uniref:ORF-29 n=1 Tax=Agrotis segetum nuclear polyhedrosis virus TaxID=1962501 RepID=Q287P3_NPVAS|nr:ORF-29 [Agrotis segetum nucleopolyhedrovirus A]AAZ38195.1 ORF-29 [Agrotis segetum nucleopolyhedrovirus A]